MKDKIRDFAFYLEDRAYVWKPFENITVHELALILPGFTSFNHIEDPRVRDQLFANWYEGLPENCKRHFHKTFYEQKN